jgi:hypothetical protein
MIDKGDNFAEPRSARTLLVTVLTAAVVSLIVSAATTFAILTTVPVRASLELVQSGHVEPPLTTLEGEVYYAVPYQAPPNLEITGATPEIRDQRKDGFKYHGLTGASFDRRARGVRGGSSPAEPVAQKTQ